jgi:hypothetical protein
MNPKIYNIADKPFPSFIIYSASEILSDTLHKAPRSEKALKKWRKSNRARMNAKERYLIDVFYRILNLSRVYDRLHYSRYLLRRSPTNFRSKQIKINWTEWTDYHFYVYTTSLASISDCLLLLIAQIFLLNIPDKYCTSKNVLGDRRIKGAVVHKSFLKLTNLLSQHIQRRHHYVHRGEESSLENYSSTGDVLMNLRTLSFLFDKGLTDKFSPKEITRLWKLQIREVEMKLDRSEKRIFRLISRIYRELKPIYVNNYSAL